MIISFCGSQTQMTKWQERELAKVFRHFNIAELCYRDYIGSDRVAVNIALECGVKNFHIFPINDSAKRAWSFPNSSILYEWIGFRTDQYGVVHYKLEPVQAPLLAGSAIVKEGAMMVSTPKEHSNSMRSATWAVIRKAWHAKKEVIIVPPIDREEDDNDSQR
jgi:hypothetical protein